MRPEAARERDLHRYYKPWKDAQNSLLDVKPSDQGNAWGLTYDGYKPRASGDKTLTAFAQLAALRLNVRRAMVSLIDSTQQFILAEATKTLSLVSDERHKPGDEVWLGNTILKKNDAVCHHTFGQKYTAKGEDGRTYTTEAMIIPDMRLDDRFKDRSYVVQQPGVLFYAGVPIRTKSGHRIGVYAVSDNKPRDALDIDELIFMEDVAAAVMEHLELARDRDARMNGENMVRGLANFIEGTEDDADNTLISSGGMAIDPSTESQRKSPRLSAVMKKQGKNARKMADDGEDNSAKSAATGRQSPKPSRGRISRDDPTRILSRAAKIIRQSTDADGVVFFNTSSRNFQALGRRSMHEYHTDISSGLNSGSERTNDTLIQPHSRLLRRGDSTDSGEELRTQSPDEKIPRAFCEVIGLSIIQNEQYGRLKAEDFQFPEENMEKYIKNFPYGNFFSFTDTGSGISSGDELSSEDKSPDNNTPLDKRPSFTRPETPARNKKERFVPTDLLKALPGIRSLIFLPLWDFTEGKYIAGGFIWTSTAGRLMNPENELPYLKAFGNSIMSEISRVKATKSDIAKTTFIASISHELRSPLHGILGSVEFLHETAVSAYQAGLFTSIETCGKTLLDTIDHVLDYAKINKLRKGSSSKRRGHTRNSQKKDQLGSIVGLTAEFDLAALVEEVVDAVTAGHVFRRSHQTAITGRDAYGLATAGTTVLETKSTLLDPVVILDIKPHENWWVRTQPGALRRIVMNLLGNALKYTDFGFASVSMQVESQTDNHIQVRLQFIDSGRGMSMEFQRNKLFFPFSQEDPFSTGTGLGLSIVRQIIDGLDGTISVCSTQQVGTEIEVVLTLPTVEKAREKQTSDPLIGSMKDTTIHIVDPEVIASHAGLQLRDADSKGLQHLGDALRVSCADWFGVKIVETSKQDEDPSADSPAPVTPDFVLLPVAPSSAEKLSECYHNGVGPDTSAPVIVICSNTAQASDFRANIVGELLEQGIQSIPVTQPLGPRKLANIIRKFNEDRVRQKQRIVLGRKESDPESIRREREILRKVHEAQQAMGGHDEKRESQAMIVKAPIAIRPGPSVQTNVTASAGGGTMLQDLLEQPTSQVMALTRIEAQASAQRSMSTPPSRPTSVVLSSSPPTSTSSKGDSVGVSQPHVLLVDDNNINLQLLVMFMKKQGIRYATASNGLEALDLYKAGFQATQSNYPPFNRRQAGSSTVTEDTVTRPLELLTPRQGLSKRPPTFTHILMDLSMPVMDGVTSSRKIRDFEGEMGIEPASTIIALTGLASAEAQDDALSAGINEFLIKPVKFVELKDRLKNPMLA